MLFAKKATVKIDGMHCEHCAARAKAALEGIEGIKSASIDLNGKKADIRYKGELPREAIESAINGIGFQFQGIEE